MQPRLSWIALASLVAAIATLSLNRSIFAEEIRTWTDKSGKFTIKAEFVEIASGKVRLKLEDGKVVTLPLAKLSDNDRVYVRDLLKARREASAAAAEEQAGDEGIDVGAPGESPDAQLPAELRGLQARIRDMQAHEGPGPAADPDLIRDMMRATSPDVRPDVTSNPDSAYKVGDQVDAEDFGRWYPGKVVGFKGSTGHLVVKLDGGNKSISVMDSEIAVRPGVDGDLKLERPDTSQVKQIVLTPGAGSGFHPDPGVPTGAIRGALPPITLSKGEDITDGANCLAVNRDMTRAVVGASGLATLHNATRFDICDLTTGKVVTTIAAPADLVHFALSPSASRLVTINKVEGVNQSPVQLWDLVGDKLQRIKSWHTVWELMEDELDWAAWPDDDHIMASNGETLTLWSVDGARAIYTISAPKISRPKFSGGGKQFAIVTDEGLFIHDAATGAVLKHIVIDGAEEAREVAFSPTGDSIAVATGLNVDIYEISSGKRVASAYSYAVWGRSSAHSLAYLDEQHVLVGGADLIHIPSQMVIWNYAQKAPGVAATSGGAWYLMDNFHGPHALVPIALPHAGATPIAESELALRPGEQVAVSVDVAMPVATTGTDAAKGPLDQLRDAAARAGFVVADGASKKLVAHLTPAAPEQVTYESSTAPGTNLQVLFRVFEVTRQSAELSGRTRQTITVTPRNLDLELLVDGQSVWTRHWVQPAPSSVVLREGEAVDAGVNRAIDEGSDFFGSAVPSRILALDVEKARSSKVTAAGLQ